MTISWHADESPIKAGLPAFDMCAAQTGPGSYPDRPGLTGSTTLTEDVADSLPVTGLPPAGTSSDALTSSPTGLGFKVTEAVFFDGNTVLYLPNSAAISSSTSTALSLSFWVESYDPILQQMEPAEATHTVQLGLVASGYYHAPYNPYQIFYGTNPSPPGLSATSWIADMSNHPTVPSSYYIIQNTDSGTSRTAWNGSPLSGAYAGDCVDKSVAGGTAYVYQILQDITNTTNSGALFAGPLNVGTGAQVACWLQGNAGVSSTSDLLLVADATRNNIDGTNTLVPTAPAAVWAHVMMSFQTVAGVLRGTLAINGDVIHSNKSLGTAAVFGLNAAASAWSVGGFLPGNDDANTGIENDTNFPLSNDGFKGCVAELWVSRTFIDFSAQANRELFHSSETFNTLGNLHPVDLGKNGQLPTSSKPLIYCSGIGTTTAGPVHMFQINRATGKRFSLSGDLILCSEPPPGSDTL